MGDYAGKTWRTRYEACINQLHATLPEDATLEDRMRALNKLRGELGVDCTSWGRKTWAKARRSYLAKYGYKKRGQKPTPLETTINERESDEI